MQMVEGVDVHVFRGDEGDGCMCIQGVSVHMGDGGACVQIFQLYPRII